MGAPPLLAVGFVHPALLGGLGLVSIPIIIHWLSRRYYRRREWAATTFLREAERETRRRVRFEQWLLLALRCLAMGLLALLVTRPYARPGLVAALLGGRGQAARIVVVDDSASLSYRSGATVEFDRLKAAADRLLSWLHQEAPRDPLTLYLTSAGGEPLVADAVLSDVQLGDLRERLARVQPSSIPARPQRVFERVAQAAMEPTAPVDADVYVLSDLQRSEWATGASRDAAPAGADAGRSVFEPLRRLRPSGRDPGSAQAGAEAAPRPAGGTRSVRVLLVASGVQPRDNVGIIDMRLERPQTVAGLPAIVRAQMANFSPRPVKDLLGQLDLDGSPLPAVPVEPVEAGATHDVLFEVTFPDEGYHVLSLTVGPVDSFRVDDTRRLAVHVKPALAVLLVDGAPAADPRADEVFLLRNALAPAGALSSGVRLDVIDPEQLEATELAGFDAVLLCNVAPLRAGAVGQLQRYVRAGGGLGIFLGSEVGDPAAYSRVMYAEGAGLLPLPLERLVASAGPGIGIVRTTEHALTAMFPAGADSLSEYVHFWRYYRCAEPVSEPNAPEPTSRPAAVVLARFADVEQTPALVERTSGQGRTVLFASTVDLDWNDWARAPDGSYVVTMLELVQYLAQRDAQPGEFVAGQLLALALAPDAYELSALFKSPAYPDEPPVEVSVRGAEAGAETVHVTGPVATQLGQYTVELTTRTGQSESRPLCVNLDPVEPDLTVATPAELDAALAGIPHTLLTAAEDFLQGAAQTRLELWPVVLVALLATLLAEQALAVWFGRTRT